MTTPIVQGWCPGALKPMMSGDGLVVRIRPVAAEISADQAQGIARAALQFGNGFIDLTNRANLQIRGVSEDKYAPLIDALSGLGLLDEDQSLETRRNFVFSPFESRNSSAGKVLETFLPNLSQFPDIPGKFGFSVEGGPRRVLHNVPADIRVEPSLDGGLILRAEGAPTGVEIDSSSALDTALDLINWFVDNRPENIRRMPKLLEIMRLPDRFQGCLPADTEDKSLPGPISEGVSLAVPFGQLAARDLQRLLEQTQISVLRITPWRSLWLPGISKLNDTNLITNPTDPRLKVSACAGMPFCPQASVETREMASRLAGRFSGQLHVSGCSKGCAHPAAADVVLVGKNGTFDLVRNGTAWDEPRQRGLSLNDIDELDLT